MKDIRPDADCATCLVHRMENLEKLGLDMAHWDYVVALAGNPNTGKSTVFNRLTGLRQHTGNWPGKTVTRAEGGFGFDGKRYKLVDLPGTYSLLSASSDEEVARNFILFGQPDVTVIVADATRLERNLNLAFQVLEITDRVVVCLNLVDEARRHGMDVDAERLSEALGVPVIPTAARQGEGMPELLMAIQAVASGQMACQPHGIAWESPALEQSVTRLVAVIQEAYPDVPNARWVALRLLEGDDRIREAVRTGELRNLSLRDTPGKLRDVRAGAGRNGATAQVMEVVDALRWEVGDRFHDALVEALYAEASRISARVVRRKEGHQAGSFDRRLDWLVTHRWTGFPVMLFLLGFVFYLTVEGANYPSALLSALLLDTAQPALKSLATGLGAPWWLSGVLIDGIYLALAWVVSVMLPPMAIFFPLFTLLEDFGYLPRVAFNLDALFRKAGAHGKQALTMSMGFGCNAAGVIAARVIDSPRERLIAILTNNFALCNGRWPTQILLASVFIGTLVPAHLAGFVSAGAVVGVTLLGIALTFVVSWALSRTVLKGQASVFSLELPPYRPPRFFQTIYTSLIDRTVFVLWRAMIFAAPAGAVIWGISNVHWGGISLAENLSTWLDPAGLLIGLNGIILVAYVVAIPANEIVIPTVLMLTVLATGGAGEGTGVMFELDSDMAMGDILKAGGWTLLTGINVMLFSLLHNPCSTTLYTIYKETHSAKWTVVSALIPLSMGLVACFLVAQVWRLFGG